VDAVEHALSTTLPAILALADTREVSGRDLIAALVKGIEIQGWIRHAGICTKPEASASTRRRWSARWDPLCPPGTCSA